MYKMWKYHILIPEFEKTCIFFSFLCECTTSFTTLTDCTRQWSEAIETLDDLCNLTWLISSWEVLIDLIMQSSWTRPESRLCSSWASSACSWLSSTLLRPSSSSWLRMSDSWERIWLCRDDIWGISAEQYLLATSWVMSVAFKTHHSLEKLELEPKHRVFSAEIRHTQCKKVSRCWIPADCGSFMAYEKIKLVWNQILQLIWYKYNSQCKHTVCKK